ncbi:FAD/NAD(P)-binding domain-containing protein [Artomyces pyxidatus]|uniref:FAD/NAD(P)-binding domain-containing protein n=1 Tax=Artomyces pyxidatus TaxID=48021 RepID=A0ACB8SR73_9AGAM|nr:FAD/NAD(P)-binding domain-containing protein [Artomyces pyxidatus]
MSSSELPYPSSTTPKFRIAIAGGGPAGLTLAAAIARFNDPTAPVAVDVYEAGPTIATVGAGIMVLPRTQSVLDHLGLAAGLMRDVDPAQRELPNGIRFRKSDQEEDGYDCFHLFFPESAVLVHRSVLLETIQAGLPPHSLCNLHTSARIVSYSSEHGNPLVLHLSDGSARTADVLIGADGIRSAVRTNLLASYQRLVDVNVPFVEPTWTGTVAYRSLIKRERLEAISKGHQAGRMQVMYCGKDKHIAAYPIARGTLVNFVAFYSVPGGEGSKFDGKWVRDAPIEEVRQRYVGWEPDVQALLACLETASAWAIHVVENIPHIAMDNVALIGDSVRPFTSYDVSLELWSSQAHAMETHFGAGAGLAMEDACILARLLTNPLTTRESLKVALETYERSRLAEVRGIFQTTRRVRDLYEFGVDRPAPKPGRENTDTPSQNAQWMTDWAENVRRAWSWEWQREVEELWVEAEQMLTNDAQAPDAVRQLQSHL